jgi:pyridoxamine 5'-phosphate oxidase
MDLEISSRMDHWLNTETQMGSTQAMTAVLSTATVSGVPHSRVVALRELDANGALFFTQKISRKVEEMLKNPIASTTIWLPLSKREIVLEGSVEPISSSENERYWALYPRESQLRFWAYAETSGQAIPEPGVLDQKLKSLRNQHAKQTIIPFSPEYCGFRIIPTRIYFYSYLTDRLSEVIEYVKAQNKWGKRYLSP